MHCSSELKMPSTPSMSVIMKTFLDAPVWAAAEAAHIHSIPSNSRCTLLESLEFMGASRNQVQRQVVAAPDLAWVLFAFCLSLSF